MSGVFLYCWPFRRWAEGWWEFLAVWAHKEGQRLSADCRPVTQSGDSTPPSQPLTSQPPIQHPLHPIYPLRYLPSSSFRLSVSSTHTWGSCIICPQWKPSLRSIPNDLSSHSSAPWTYFHPTHYSTLKEAPQTKAPLHSTTSIPQSAASASQYHPDAQQKPWVTAGKPYWGPTNQQVGAQKADLEHHAVSKLMFSFVPLINRTD